MFDQFQSDVWRWSTYCCCKLSWREHRVWHPGNGHLWFRSPVWMRVWRARCPLVVNPRSQVGHTCFLGLAAEPADDDGGEGVGEVSYGLCERWEKDLVTSARGISTSARWRWSGWEWVRSGSDGIKFANSQSDYEGRRVWVRQPLISSMRQ